MVSFLTLKKALIICFIFVSAVFLFHKGVSLAGEKNPSPGKEFSGVDFKNGLLKISVDKQSFKKVMSEIAKKAEIKIFIYFAAEEELTIDFDYLPLEKGLVKLLRGRNYAFCRSREDQQPDRLTSVTVFSREEGVSVAMKDGQQQRLEEILQRNFINELDMRQKIDEAMEKVKEAGISKEIEMVKGEIGQDFLLDEKNVATIVEKINMALDGITAGGSL
ncbi:MAG: hypothetical protein K8F52_12685 [Candidatus Scalindua rubra]|uniref:Uncharacterized protein n=1 Tax=Candidatus Scalindua brodae TaxID=237368 RepID=A0A0B0EKX9_9BACT|nr:MAG: hypothetical protein SCABRO_03010 [Candidatus Scalindua brodae]MBZ0109515.1 hypothetical protein [Candidatus Scalindua rubra]TWU36924.1 hypothetical protein S225a_04210 [Candidatus Brocadiaceae bacterium S225]